MVYTHFQWENKADFNKTLWICALFKYRHSEYIEYIRLITGIGTKMQSYLTVLHITKFFLETSYFFSTEVKEIFVFKIQLYSAIFNHWDSKVHNFVSSNLITLTLDMPNFTC